MGRPTTNADDSTALRAHFDMLQQAYRAHQVPTVDERQRWLRDLRRVLIERREDLAACASMDFSSRSRHETLLADVFVTVEHIRYLQKNLSTWMAPRSRKTSLPYMPGKSEVHLQPLGVVGIIAPWNYPVQLAIIPMATALAAGNRVMLKPSEVTSKTAVFLKELVDAALPSSIARVVLGDAKVAADFSALPFDHLMFTGSSHVGKIVAKAAAENLTPVTLELGGKSPALIHPDADLRRASARIVAGKLFNGGQTCVAPDYCLVDESRRGALVGHLRAAISKSYSSLRDNGDYTAVVTPRHKARLTELIEDARQKGAQVVEVNLRNEDLDDTQKLCPTLLFDVNDDMRVMQEEIFGPILPIETYRRFDEGIERINDRPRPLCMYYFDDNDKRIADVLAKTISGGVSVNETLLHVAQDDLPFGGIGLSGMGAYHGPEGFETFSHKRAVFRQRRFSAVSMFTPPYGDTIDKLISAVLKR